MARNIGADGAAVYRAVIDFGDGVRYEGPYTSAGTARGRITFWQNYLRDESGETKVTGRVEQAQTTWVTVE